MSRYCLSSLMMAFFYLSIIVLTSEGAESDKTTTPQGYYLDGEVVIQFNDNVEVSDIENVLNRYKLKVKSNIGPLDCSIKVLKGNVQDYVSILESSDYFSGIDVPKIYNEESKRLEEGSIIFVQPKYNITQKKLEDFIKSKKGLEIEKVSKAIVTLVTVEVPKGREEELSKEIAKLPKVLSACPNYLFSPE